MVLATTLPDHANGAGLPVSARPTSRSQEGAEAKVGLRRATRGDSQPVGISREDRSVENSVDPRSMINRYGADHTAQPRAVIASPPGGRLGNRTARRRALAAAPRLARKLTPVSASLPAAGRRHTGDGSRSRFHAAIRQASQDNGQHQRLNTAINRGDEPDERAGEAPGTGTRPGRARSPATDRGHCCWRPRHTCSRGQLGHTGSGDRARFGRGVDEERAIFGTPCGWWCRSAARLRRTHRRGHGAITEGSQGARRDDAAFLLRYLSLQGRPVRTKTNWSALSSPADTRFAGR